MPRYYFHIRDEDGVSRDEEGTELPDLEAAEAEARASIRDLLVDYVRKKKAVVGQQLDIADQSGRVIETMEVRDILN